MSRSVDQHAEAVAALIQQADDDRSRCQPVEAEVRHARGRLALAIRAQLDIPAFDNSQMDGFAVRSADLRDAGPEPVTLTTTAHVVAGGDQIVVVKSGETAPIMTGAPLPEGIDTVVPVERTVERDFGPVGGGATVTFVEPAEPEAFVRRRGTDAKTGDVLLEAGTPLTPGVIGALVAANVSTVSVRPPLRLGIVSSGTEVARGDIPDANLATLAAHSRELGLPFRSATVADEPTLLTRALDDLATECDLIITTGGVSAGAHEVVRQVLEPTPGAWFDHVNLQPGGPQGLARWDCDGRSVPVVSLPGNPVSVMVSFELFLRRPLAFAAGMIADRPSGLAPLAATITSPPGRMQVRRGLFNSDGHIALEGGPGSHLVASYARSELLVFVPADVTDLEAGADVKWWRITPPITPDSKL